MGRLREGRREGREAGDIARRRGRHRTASVSPRPAARARCEVRGLPDYALWWLGGRLRTLGGRAGLWLQGYAAGVAARATRRRRRVRALSRDGAKGTKAVG